MKYFISDLGSTENKDLHTCLAFPLDHTERIVPHDACDSDAVSIPSLLKTNNISVLHGIILKSGMDSASVKRTSLLVPRIDIEIDIPDEEIYSLPKVLEDMLKYFKGVHFTDQKMILIFDPNKLFQIDHREQR